MATTQYTFTLRSGADANGLSVVVNGSQYRIDRRLTAGGGSFTETDPDIAAALVAKQKPDGSASLLTYTTASIADPGTTPVPGGGGVPADGSLSTAKYADDSVTEPKLAPAARAKLNAGGLPTGGTAGQTLSKQSSSNGDATWAAPPTVGAGLAVDPVPVARAAGASGGGVQRSLRVGKLPAFTRTGSATSGSNGTDTREYSVTAYQAEMDGVGLDVLLDNWSGTNGAILVRGAAVFPDGSLCQLATGEGKTSLQVEQGMFGWMGCGGAFKAGDVIVLRLFVQAVDASGAPLVGGKWPQVLRTASPAYGETVVVGSGASDLTMAAASSQPAAANGPSYRPAGIFTVPQTVAQRKIVVLVGDSIPAGTGDDFSLLSGPGFLARAAHAAAIPYVNTAISGSVIGDILNGRVRMRALECATTIYEEAGANSLITGTLASIQALKISTWRAMAAYGVRVRTLTLFPRDAIGSTQIAVRATVNQWIRDGAPLSTTDYTPAAVGATGSSIVRFGQTGHPVHGYDDIAAATETATDSGLYKTGYSDDGVHPNAVGHAAAAAAVNTGLWA